jgi:hypothetical protein
MKIQITDGIEIDSDWDLDTTKNYLKSVTSYVNDEPYGFLIKTPMLWIKPKTMHNSIWIGFTGDKQKVKIVKEYRGYGNFPSRWKRHFYSEFW